MNTRPWTTMAVLVLAGCAAAQTSPNSPAPSTSPPAHAATQATAGQSVDALLEALDRRGDSLGDFSASLHLTEIDEVTQLATERTGRIWFQHQGPGDARIRIVFDRRITDRGRRPEKLEYVLDDGQLLDRDYQKRIEVTRQVVRPGEQVDLLSLGEGPFPLPLGQDPAEVRRQFDVQLAGGERDDAAPRLILVPRADGRFVEEFSRIEVTVDPATSMPVRIATADAEQRNSSTIELSETTIDAGLADKDFQPEQLTDRDQWQVRFEAYER